jgi:hypothetical protein
MEQPKKNSPALTHNPSSLRSAIRRIVTLLQIRVVMDDREMFSVTPIPCCGRKGVRATDDREDSATRYEAALEKPVTAVIKTFRDTTHEVLCPHLTDNFTCSSAPAPSSPHDDKFPPCAYASKPKRR